MSPSKITAMQPILRTISRSVMKPHNKLPLLRAYSTKPPSTNLKPQSVSQISSVLSAVQQYPDGMQKGEVSLTAKAFHNDATMYGYFGGSLLGGPITNLWDYVNAYGASKDIKTRIDVLGITPTTAVARVEMENDNSEVDFTDFHTLVKFEDGWRIVSKVFHAYDRK